MNHYRGALADMADSGRHGDTELMHVTPEEIEALERLLGPTTTNPETGLREAFSWQQALPALVSAFAPSIGTGVGEFVGATGDWAPIVGNALVGGATGYLTGQDPLRSAAIGGLSSAAMQALTGDGLNLFGSSAPAPAAAAPRAPQQAPQPAPVVQGGGGGPGMPTMLPQQAPDPMMRSAFPLTAGVTPQAPANAPQAPPQGFMDAMKVKWDKLGPLEKMLIATQVAGAANSMRRPRQSGPPPSRVPAGFNDPLPVTQVRRQSIAPQGDWYTYGERPQQAMFSTSVRRMATGGLALAAGEPAGGLEEMMDDSEAMPMGGGPVGGPGSGREDLIPAQLSDGEYVLDAEIVALLGDGSTDEGARRLDGFRENIRAHKGGALARGRISPDAKAPEDYLGGE
jgi:hypothetical protein